MMVLPSSSACLSWREVVSIFLTRPLRARIGYQPAHSIELVIARENQVFLTCLSPFIILLLDLLDELLHQVEHAAPCPDAFPEIGRSESFPRWRVACAAITPLVERQETSFGPLEMRGHVDKVGINCEMGQAAAKGEERFTRVAIKAILLNSILDILSRERVLDFSSEDRH